MTEFLGITKPSQALLAMVEGLRNPGNIKIDMETWGDVEAGVCYGCAATVTLQHLSGQEFNQHNINRFNRELMLGGQECYTPECCDQLANFEAAIDDARRGDLIRLFEFFGFAYRHLVVEFRAIGRLVLSLSELHNDYTAGDLRQYELVAIELENEGF